MKFPNLRAMFGLSDKQEVSAISEEQMTAAEGKIAQLEADKTKAEGDLATATTKLTAAEGRAEKAEGEATTLRDWKKQQQATDGRTEDDSNDLDGDGQQPKAAWELAADSAIAATKRRLGVK